MLFTSLLEAKEFSQDKSTKEYGVYFLIPEGEVKNKALDISKRLGNDITPHITVLQTVCNQQTVLDIQRELNIWSESQRVFSIQFQDKIVGNDDGKTFWNIQDLKKLSEINKDLSSKLENLRDGVSVQVKNKLHTFSNQELIDYKKYGRQSYVPGNNNPHITVSYTTDDKLFIDQISRELKNKIFKQEITEVSFGEIDDSGNIVKTISTYKLVK